MVKNYYLELGYNIMMYYCYKRINNQNVRVARLNSVEAYKWLDRQWVFAYVNPIRK